MGDVGAGPREPVRGFDNAAQVRDLVRQVPIRYAPEIEDDDQGPFLTYEDAVSLTNALWPRIATLTRERDEAQGHVNGLVLAVTALRAQVATLREAAALLIGAGNDLTAALNPLLELDPREVAYRRKHWEAAVHQIAPEYATAPEPAANEGGGE